MVGDAQVEQPLLSRLGREGALMGIARITHNAADAVRDGPRLPIRRCPLSFAETSRRPARLIFAVRRPKIQS